MGAGTRETGSGMGATLNVAVGMNAYCLTDRATWISFANKQGLGCYTRMIRRFSTNTALSLVDSKNIPMSANAKAGQIFVDWMIGKAGQTAIANFRRSGQQLFFPNASP